MHRSAKIDSIKIDFSMAELIESERRKDQRRLCECVPTDRFLPVREIAKQAGKCERWIRRHVIEPGREAGEIEMKLGYVPRCDGRRQPATVYRSTREDEGEAR